METWACASCGGENPAGTRFCGHCGTAADVSAAPADTSTETDVTDALRSFVAGQVAERIVATGGHIPEERRLITALFADVSGFTSLADRLDPEALLEVIDPVIAALSSIVGRYEGYVEKFAGDALLALFGAPVSHEDDPARALQVALEMHRELERICAELPEENRDLTLHVGVNSGHGIARILGSEARTDYAVLGDSVILAQRLESAAPSGETYVSDTTYRMTREHFEFEPVGELTLKGKSEPVLAWRLVGGRREARPTGGRLVGRESELAVVAGVLEGVVAGAGGVVTLTGEPGVGKSRLTEEARSLASARGIRWLHTRCLAYGSAVPYWPYTELLRDVAGISVDDPPAHASELLAAAFGPLPDEQGYVARLLGLPSRNGDVAELGPEAFRRGLHDAVATWLDHLVGDRPVVLALEDAHWADASTLALTAELAALCDGRPLALFLIARPEAGEALLEAAPGAHAIGLEPLDAHGVARLLEDVLGGEPPDVAELVLDRTGGNPFFVRELVAALRESGALASANGAWRLRRGWTSDEVPATIEGVLAARIDSLPRDAADVLGVASVIGRRVPVTLLQEVAGPTDDLAGAVDRLESGGFLDRSAQDGEERLVFHHALTQDVAYSRLLRRRQRDLHGRVAEVAEQLYGAGDDVIDLLARHLYLGEGGAKAVEYGLRAGERARRLFANDEAIVHLTRAAELAAALPEFAERLPELQLALGDLYELVGDYESARAHYADVRDGTSDPRAWAGIASTHRSQGEYERALATVDDAFAARVDGDRSPLWLERAWTLSVAGRFEEAAAAARAGLDANAVGGAVRGHLLLQLARAETVTGPLGTALEHAEQAIDILEREDDTRGLGTAMRIAGNVHAREGRYDDAANALRRGLQLAERTGSVEEIGGCLINLGLVELERGAIAEAIECDRRAAGEFERIGHGSGRAAATGNLAEKLAHAGRYDEALAESERALAIAAEIGHAPTTADVTRTIAWTRLQQGEYRSAAEGAEEAAELFAAMGAAQDASAALELAAEAWTKAGDRDRAGAARSRLPSA